ncbi:MAG: hypothetical protein RMJ56_11405 [Gemmataceae bacterium]|nr:hypothetical protein [Gemmata sp.]MDW8198197.1 hypothetical protein [Gemmataceae bacterium]
MRAIRCFVAALLAAGMVTLVSAQPGPGFGFGFGGLDVTNAVLTNTDLQQEIKVTDQQKEKFKPLADKQAEFAKELREAFGGGGKFDKEKFAEINEKRTKLNEEIRKVVDETLTAEQKKRLKQISIQLLSFNVFNDPNAKGGGGGKGGGGFGFRPTEAQRELIKEVQSALNLTDSQKNSIKELTAEFNRTSGEIRREAGIGFGFGKGKQQQPDPEKVAEANKKIEKLRSETWAKIEETLDDNQKKAWKELVGAPFDISKLTQPRQPRQRD